jgi:hypothetical protein
MQPISTLSKIALLLLAVSALVQIGSLVLH